MNWKLTLGSVFLLSIGTNLSAHAQDVPEHEKKVFTDDDGTVYWNKELPVYIRLSTSPDADAPSELLEKDTKGRYANMPYFFDTEGPNYIRTRWAVDPETGEWVYPRDEVLWEVQTDGIAPSTTIRFSETRPYRKDGKLYFKGEVTISLSSSDRTSGVDKIYYSLNGKPWQAYENPVELTESGEYTLKTYAVDRVGNVETLQERTFIIDKDSPQSRLEIEGDRSGNVVSGRTRFSLTATDDAAGVARIQFSVDGGPVTTYSNTLAMTGLAQGEHTITYQATDLVNNLEESNTYKFYVDRDPPQVIHEILGDVYVRNGVQYVSGRAQIKLAAFDNKAGLMAIYYSTDKENFNLYEKPFYLNAEAQENGISYYAVDSVNNRVSTQFKQAQDGTFANIDLSGPTLSQRFQGPTVTTRDTVFISPETKVVLQGSDPASGLDYLAYSVNGQSDETRYDAPFSISEAGDYSLQYFGYDQVGNRNRSEFTFHVDAEAPEISFAFDGPAIGVSETDTDRRVYPAYVSLFLSAKDNLLSHRTLSYSINGTSARTYQGPIRGFAANRDYDIKVTVADRLGNESTTTISFRTGE